MCSSDLDLDYDIMTRILEDLAAGKEIKVGSQIGRNTSEAEGGPTNLKEMVDANHDYRGEW